jgi:hypothetical protein
MKEITKQIQDDESLICIVAPTEDLPSLIEAICANQNYQEQISNPLFLGNQMESEENKRTIDNPDSRQVFCVKWLIRQAYEQRNQHVSRLATIEMQKTIEQSKQPISAKPLI